MDFSDIAETIRLRVQEPASSIEEIRTAYADLSDGSRVTATTIVNGFVKPEGGGIGTVDPEDAESLIDPMVECCLSLRTSEKDGLLWRRLPSAEIDGGKLKITARLCWKPRGAKVVGPTY